ncbi:cobalt-precorrin-6A reductase [Rhodovulum sp. YNF3179]|uniref:cobalt-precorrin-6A reductase n=1 Tax=Rhodovulum sp. YNF3179 TaxID=3425127 RepID=UPI003D359898
MTGDPLLDRPATGPDSRLRLLLLAGSGEARALASALAGDPRLAVIASLSGAARARAPLPVPTRSGGFGGRAGFERFLDAERIGAILDATHPFARRISARSAAVAAARGLPHLLVLRPEWAPGPGDDWVFVDREEEAAAHIPDGATVFLTTGRQGMEGFANLHGRHLIFRQIGRAEAPFPWPNGEFLVSHPPIGVADEIALFRARGVDVLVLRNAGGVENRAKLVAARALGIRVVMLRRPPPPDCTRVETVADALDWVDGLVTP